MSWFDKVQNSFENSSNWIKIANNTFNSEIRNVQDRFFKTSNASTFSASQIGILTGISIAILVNVKTNKPLQKIISNFKRSDGLSLFTIFIIYSLVLPISLATLGTFAIYRHCVNIYLKIQFGKRFRSILDANDAVWTVEQNTWRSVINILAVMEERVPKPDSSEHKAEIILALLRDKFRNLIADESEPKEKIFYSLNRIYGYSFWTMDSIKLEDYIRFTDIPSTSEYLTSEELKSMIGRISNQSLHGNHSKLWEILVSRKPVKENGTTNYPIICRVHHSLGDGVSLLRFFLEAIADRETIKSCENVPESPENQIKGTRLDFHIKTALQNLIKLMKLISAIPFYISEHLSTPQSNNCLHGPGLTGVKTSSWLYESNNSYLLPRLRRLKRKIPKARFSDLILTALSASLHKYFRRSGTDIPKSIQIIVPARIQALDKQLKLENKFSVAIQTLPIVPPLEEGSDVTDVAAKVSVIKEKTDQVRSKPDYLINYGIMAIFGYLLPYPILNRILDSKLATMVFSNLPGPTEEATLGNYRITSLSFDVPLRDLTGIGVTLLTYAGKLHISICADKALIPNGNHTQDILQDMENEIINYVTIFETK